MTGSNRSGGHDSERFPERDWRHLRIVHAAALERYCHRVIQECRAVLGEVDLTAHERYLRTFKLLQERDEELASVFDDMRRSNAIPMLASMIRLDLITTVELDQFGQDVREAAVGIARVHSQG